MANLDESLEKRLTETITRYRENETDRQTHEANLQQTGDWREVESPERLLNRMVALGLRRLAGSTMESDTVTQSVDSAAHPGQKVNLLERVIEESDFLEARFLHIGSAVARTVGRVPIRERGRTVGYGTGFLVSPRLLMTNNHVLESEEEAAQCAVEFDYYERR